MSNYKEEAVGLNLSDLLASYIQDYLTANNKETIAEKDAEKYERGSVRDCTLEAIGEPLREAKIYEKNLYATRGGDCYRLLQNGKYRYLQKRVDNKDDLVVCITYDKSSQYIKIKRIVAHAWLEMPEELKNCYMPWVEHKDGDRRNNHASNLSWIQPPKNYYGKR